MAQDFHQETYYKRYTLTKLAYEAQYVCLKKMEKKLTKDTTFKIKEITGPNGETEGKKKEISPYLKSDEKRLNPHAIINYPQEQNGLDNPLDALNDREKDLFAQPELGDFNDFMDIGGEKDELIKSDLDHLSNKSFEQPVDDPVRYKSTELYGRNFQKTPLSSPGLPNGRKFSESITEGEQMKKYQDEIKSIIIDEPMEIDGNWHNPSLPPVTKMEQILITDTQILEDMDNWEQRIKDFDEIMAESKTDFKYLSYNDMQIHEFDKSMYVESLTMDNSDDKMSNINFIKTIENFIEDKYSTLEHKRIDAEKSFQRMVEQELEQEYQVRKMSAQKDVKMVPTRPAPA